MVYLVWNHSRIDHPVSEQHNDKTMLSSANKIFSYIQKEKL